MSPRRGPSPALRALAAVLVLVCATTRAAHGHEGPPYAILSDRAAGPYVLEVWADPDVGTGTFNVHVEPDSEHLAVEVRVCPSDGRVGEAAFPARRRVQRNGVVWYDAEVSFDTEELWRVRVVVNGPLGAGEAATDVEVTPPGQGALLDFVLYGLPFALVALLFLKAAIGGRRTGRAPR